MPENDTISVVVIGGGFAGRAAIRQLRAGAHNTSLDILLIDQKPFFEFTPSTLRCIVETEHLDKITYSQTLPNVRFVHGIVTHISQSHVTVQFLNGRPGYEKYDDSCKIAFDYCIWATGSTYSAPISSAGDERRGVTDRRVELARYRERITRAERVLIIGAGPVGVELAAEIANFIHEKGLNTIITLASSARGILPKLPRRAGEYAEKQLRKMGARVTCGRFVPKGHNSEGKTIFENSEAPASDKNETALVADLVIECTGARPLTVPDMLATAAGGWTQVRSTLQLEAMSHVFAAGDAISLSPAPGDEGSADHVVSKTAFVAEESGYIAARNVLTLIHARRTGTTQDMRHFPRDAFPFGALPCLYVVSLYKWDAVLCIGPLVICGGVAALMKTFVEYSNISAGRGNIVAHWVVGFSKTLGFLFAALITFVMPAIGNLGKSVRARVKRLVPR